MPTFKFSNKMVCGRSKPFQECLGFGRTLLAFARFLTMLKVESKVVFLIEIG